MNVLDLPLCVWAFVVCVPSLYLFWLTLWSARLPTPAPPAPSLRFDVVVPAHNEGAGIGPTVRSLLALDYPLELRRVLVVADNCSDDTAERAREAGAEVLVRQDATLRGKGYALAFAFAHSAQGSADAVVVVDADTQVSPNLLQAFSARLAAGAVAAQAHYGVANPHASWRTRLMSIAFALFHILRSLGRERLGVSCGLRGNGMCFSHALLKEVPHEAFSLVEDLEYGIRLGKAGYRVHYAHEAEVLGEMVSSEKASRSQRQRWEGGRLRMAQEQGVGLLVQGLKERSGLLLDLAMDVLVPPLAWLAGLSVLGLFFSLGLSLWQGQATTSSGFFGLSLVCLTLYVLRGWQLSGMGLRGLLDLGAAPFYLLWKVKLALSPGRNKSGEWVRTSREAERPTGPPANP